jgi:Zn ribbon nucleic-acid-binding protein
LRSPLARQFAAAAGSQAHLSRVALSEVHLPQPDEALSAALEDLARSATLFAGWRAEAQALLDSVFADDSAAGTRRRIVGTGRKIRMRSEAAALLDDAGYTLRTTFPYPVAYRWREVEAAVSARSFKMAYEAILAAAEVLLCYVANTGLAIARESGIELGAMKTIRARLNPGAHGLGFGDWVTVIKEIEESKATRKAAESSPLTDLGSFLADSDAGAALRRLSDRRNDESHLRRTELMDLPAAVDAALADLSALYQAAGFLSDLPLIQVTDFRWDSFRKRAVMSFRELIGDHPVVPTRTITYDQPAVEVGSTYILDGQRRLWLLRPFLAGRTCPQCRNWSTFHIDEMREEKVIYKSLEHGHTMENAELDEALAHVGLI